MRFSVLVNFVVVMLMLGLALAIEFEGFSDTSELQLNGSAAAVVTQDGTVLRLTPNEGGRAGSAFSTRTLNARTFSSAFRFRITEPGGVTDDCNEKPGADGLVFVIQPVSSSLGVGGGGIGYSGIARSVGIEFDTWCNVDAADPNSNHVGLLTLGNIGHSGLPVEPVEPDFDNGSIWYVWVDYDGTRLEVRVSRPPGRPGQPTLSQELDIPGILETDTAYVGFTSGTGAAWGNYDILGWEYRESHDPVDDPIRFSLTAPTVQDTALIVRQGGLERDILFTERDIAGSQADLEESRSELEQLEVAITDLRNQLDPAYQNVTARR